MKKVLIVDDDDAIRELVARILEMAGYETCTARDGHEALEQFRAERPDLVVTDLVMPLMDGFELCRRIRGFSSVPIIVMTGAGTIDRSEAVNVGANLFLAKPLRVDELLGHIASLLRSP